MRECLVCGDSFKPVVRKSQGPKRYCSRACYLEDVRRPKVVCDGCGVKYRPKESNRDKYCSRECWFENGLPNRPTPLAGQRTELWCFIPWRSCRLCGNQMVDRQGRKYCSDRCAWAWAAGYRSSEESRRCPGCGRGWVKRPFDNRVTYCSRECCSRSNRRKSKASRRARKKGGAAAHRIDPVLVCRRDGWRCQLCGVGTPERLRGTYDDRAPEVDHIIPLAAGGAHAWFNVQCACRRCNQEKGARPMGQLLIAGHSAQEMATSV